MEDYSPQGCVTIPHILIHEAPFALYVPECIPWIIGQFESNLKLLVLLQYFCIIRLFQDFA